MSDTGKTKSCVDALHRHELRSKKDISTNFTQEVSAVFSCLVQQETTSIYPLHPTTAGSPPHAPPSSLLPLGCSWPVANSATCFRIAYARILPVRLAYLKNRCKPQRGDLHACMHACINGCKDDADVTKRGKTASMLQAAARRHAVQQAQQSELAHQAQQHVQQQQQQQQRLHMDVAGKDRMSPRAAHQAGGSGQKVQSAQGDEKKILSRADGNRGPRPQSARLPAAVSAVPLQDSTCEGTEHVARRPASARPSFLHQTPPAVAHGRGDARVDCVDRLLLVPGLAESDSFGAACAYAGGLRCRALPCHVVWRSFNLLCGPLLR